jgi:hypothetical protein
MAYADRLRHGGGAGRRPGGSPGAGGEHVAGTMEAVTARTSGNGCSPRTIEPMTRWSISGLTMA